MAGYSSVVHNRLKAEWTVAIPASVALSDKIAGANSARTMQKTLSQTMEPMTLKLRWTMAARFAFLFVPKEARMAVMHVPMFCPMMMGIAAA